jgi:hypothetical protein
VDASPYDIITATAVQQWNLFTTKQLAPAA